MNFSKWFDWFQNGAEWRGAYEPNNIPMLNG